MDSAASLLYNMRCTSWQQCWVPRCEACRWLVEGLWHGVVCFFVPLLTLGQSRRSGVTNGIFSYGVATYTALIIIVNLKVSVLLCLS